MEKKKEMRVYIVNYDFIAEKYGEDYNIDIIDDESFMTMAEELGSVYSLKGFQAEWNYNSEMLSMADYSYMRFIEVEQ